MNTGGSGRYSQVVVAVCSRLNHIVVSVADEFPFRIGCFGIRVFRFADIQNIAGRICHGLYSVGVIVTIIIQPIVVRRRIIQYRIGIVVHYDVDVIAVPTAYEVCFIGIELIHRGIIAIRIVYNGDIHSAREAVACAQIGSHSLNDRVAPCFGGNNGFILRAGYGSNGAVGA